MTKDYPWVLIIQAHREDAYVAEERKTLDQKLFDYVEMRWGDVMEEPIDEEATKDDVIEEYFDSVSDENYIIIQANYVS